MLRYRPPLAHPPRPSLTPLSGAATCSAVCSACGKCQNSIATRIAYALILLLNSILSWLTLTDWAVKKLQGVLLDYVTIDCIGKECFGFAAVHRVNFSLGCFHAILAVLLLGVNSSKDKRAPIQNGFWGPKIIAWLGLIVVSFLIPNRFFEVWGNYVAFVGAMLFLLLGLILLVDLAHTWAEHCIEKIEDTDSGLWRGLLIGTTMGMYLGSIAMTVVMYIFFARTNCSMNQAAITVSWETERGGILMLTRHPDQHGLRPGHQRSLHPPHDPILEPARRPRPGSDRQHLLYLPDPLRRSYGA